MRTRGRTLPRMAKDAYVRSVLFDRASVSSPDAYPFSIPAVRALVELPLHPRVTFLVGENGSGFGAGQTRYHLWPVNGSTREG